MSKKNWQKVVFDVVIILTVISETPCIKTFIYYQTVDILDENVDLGLVTNNAHFF